MKWFLLLVACCIAIGCDQSLAEKAQKSEVEINRLAQKTNDLRRELTASRKELSNQIAEVDELLSKIDKLVPAPTPAPTPSPDVVPPKPTPTPDPLPPKPNPEPVDGRFALAKAVWKIGCAVQSPDKVSEANQLAAVFESVASQVQAGALNGTLLEPQWRKISIALATGNKPIIAKNIAAWDEPAKQLGQAISSRFGRGELNNNQDWADMLNEISKGLRAVQ